MFDIRADDVSRRPMRINMIGAVLSVIFVDENQGIELVGAMSHFVDQFGNVSYFRHQRCFGLVNTHAPSGGRSGSSGLEPES